MKHLVTMFLLCSCAEDSKTPVDCVSLTTEECSEASECTVINGSDMLDNGACYTLGELEPRGCMDADQACNAYETPASNGEDPVVIFTTDCLPEGYDIVIFEQYPECE